MAYVVTSETSFPGEPLAAYTASIPAGHQANDLLLAIITQDGGGTAIAVSGWTQIGTQAASQAQRTTAFWKLATGSSEADFSATGSTDEWIVTIVVIRGANTTTPIHLEDRTNSANSTTAFLDSGTVTTTEDNTLLIYAWGFDNIFKLIPQNPADLVMLARETDFVGCVQIVGYRHKRAVGATPVVRALSEVASEGGSALVIAISDATPSTPQLGPFATETYTVFKRYGGITSAATTVAAFIRHDSVTWDTATTLAASTINSTAVIDAATATEITLQDVNRPWGSMTGLNRAGSAIDNAGRWVGGTHAVSSTNMSGKLFTIEIQMSSVATTTFGPKGVIIVFQDSSNNWVAHQVTTRAGMLAAVSYTYVVDLAGTTPFDSSGVINWADITRVGYLYHKRTTATTAVVLRIKNALLLAKTIFVDGCAASPCSPALASRLMDGWGPSQVATLQGAGQALWRSGYQIGQGSRATVFKSAATSTELPLAPTAAITRRFWQVPALSTGAQVRILASANDVIDLSASVYATQVREQFVIDATSSASATYNFAGASFVGWNFIHDNASITVNAATLKGSQGVSVVGPFDSCIFDSPQATPGCNTNDLELFTDCRFVSAGTGHAIVISTPGTYNFTGNEFVGYGANASTDAAIFNDSAGLVTIVLPIGGEVPTYRNGGGASTVIVSPSTVDIIGASIDNVEMRRYSDHAVLETRVGSGQIDTADHVTVEVYFVRIDSSQVIASSYSDPITIAAGDNGTIPLFVGSEVQIGNIDAVAADVWTYGTRTLTSGGGGGDSKEDIYTYFTSSSRQDTFKANVSGLATTANATVINDGIKKASLLIPHTTDL